MVQLVDIVDRRKKIGIQIPEKVDSRKEREGHAGIS